MSVGFTFEALGANHDRAAFSCGVPALDRYLRELATQDVRRRVSNCFVALDPPAKLPVITPSPQPAFS